MEIKEKYAIYEGLDDTVVRALVRTLSSQHQQGMALPSIEYSGKNMAGRKITDQIGKNKAADRSPPFGQAKKDRDYSLLRAKILAKLYDEDVRTALTRLGR